MVENERPLMIVARVVIVTLVLTVADVEGDDDDDDDDDDDGDRGGSGGDGSGGGAVILIRGGDGQAVVMAVGWIRGRFWGQFWSFLTTLCPFLGPYKCSFFTEPPKPQKK